jgi:Transmembrane domain of unknown function (DUF3566)
MSDRPQGSVRTGTRGNGSEATPAGAEAVPAVSETRAEPSVSSTQSIPTGQNRVVQAGRQPAAPVPPPATGERPATAVPGQSRPAGSAVPATGAAAAAATKTPAKAPGKAKAISTAGRKPATKGGRGPRRARLQLRHIDTWSAFKISFVLSVALFFIWMVAVGVLYGVLSGLGVFDTLNELFGQLSSSGGGNVITPGVVFGAAAVIGAVNIILLTALGTVTTFIYNLCSDLVGGLEVTLSERD